MKILHSGWGGHRHAREVQVALGLLATSAELVEVEGEETFRDAIAAAARGPGPSLLVFSEGFVNELGPGAAASLPEDRGEMRVIWVDVDVPQRRDGEPLVRPDGGDDRGEGEDGSPGPLVAYAALELMGSERSTLADLLSAVDGVLRPRFDRAVLSGSELYCYDGEMDLELHLDLDEVRGHVEAGSLRGWIEAMVEELDDELAGEG